MISNNFTRTTKWVIGVRCPSDKSLCLPTTRKQYTNPFYIHNHALDYTKNKLQSIYNYLLYHNFSRSLR